MGELLAALELEGMGYETSLVDAPGYDLIVNYNDRPLRIQVKSGHPFAKNATSKTKRYTYQTTVEPFRNLKQPFPQPSNG